MFNNSPDSVATVNLIDIIVLLKLFSNRITIFHSSLKSKLKSVKSGVDDPNKLNSRKKPNKKTFFNLKNIPYLQDPYP